MDKYKKNQLTGAALRRLYLSTALVSALSGSAVAQQFTSDGTSHQIPGNSMWSTTGDSQPVLSAINGGRIDSIGPVVITSSGVQAPGAFSSGEGSFISLLGGSVTTTGNYSYGLSAGAFGTISSTGNPLVIQTSGAGAWGASATTGGSLILENTLVSTSGADAYGVSSTQSSSFVGDGLVIETNGSDAFGVGAGAGGTIKLDSSLITTNGARAAGVLVVADSHAELSDTSIETFGLFGTGIVAAGGSIGATALSVVTHGEGTEGLYVGEAGSTVSYDKGSIETFGQYSVGAIAQASGRLSVTDTTITTHGNNASGLLSRLDSQIEGAGLTINTNGDNADGVLADFGPTQIHLLNTEISTKGVGSDGLQVSDGATVTFADGVIATQGIYGYGARVLNGANSTIRNAYIKTAGDGAYGLDAGGTGSMIHASNLEIETGGDVYGITSASGVVAEAGGNVDITDSIVRTTGNFGKGLFSQEAQSILTASGITITTKGQQAHGVEAYLDGANLTLTDGSIVTSNTGAHGAVANWGGEVTLENTDVTTNGILSSGVEARGDGSLMDYDGNGVQTVLTRGDVSAGARAVDGGSVVLNDAAFSTEGNGSYALNSIGAGSSVTASDVKISTAGGLFGGTTASAVVAEFGGHIGLEHGAIVTTGASGMGLLAQSRGTQADPTTTISASDVTVNTVGEGAHGIAVCSLPSGGTQNCTDAGIQPTEVMNYADAPNVSLDLTGATINTFGTGSFGVHVLGSHASTVVSSVAITTVGDVAEAVKVDGGQAELDRVNLGTFGENSHGITATDGAIVTLVNGDVKTSGSSAHGLNMSGASSSIAASKSSVYSAAGVGISADAAQGAKVSLQDGTTVSSGTGVVIRVGVPQTDEATTPSSLEVAAAGNVKILGDVLVYSGNTTYLSLAGSSFWAGAGKGVSSTAIDTTSHWLMTGSSDVGALSNDGVVDFDAANPYKTLTAGSLAMNGGSFILNTKLNEGGAASETDKIVVTGDATGNGLINIRNNGGTGAFTGTGATDGIQIVEVGGASDAEFKLGSAAIVGIYDYQLKKADGQNWYLQTEGSDVVDPPACAPGVDCPGDGGDDGDGTGNPGPGTGHVVDIVPGYNIALSAAQNHVLTSLDTFHERLGELRAEELQDGYHAWMRGIGKTGSYSPKSITGYNGHGFDMTTAGVQIGADYSKSDVFVAGDKLTIGMFGEYANSSFDVRGRTADGSISSKGLGGYVTWQQKAPTDRKPGTGAYVDAVVKQNWLEFGVNAKSVSGFDLQNGYKGKATTASIETGYGFDLGNNVVLQPQAQLTWSKVKADSFTDSYGIAVHGQEAESLIGRIGVRLEKTFYFGDEEETVEAAPVPAPKAQKQVKGKKGKAAKAVPAVLPDAPKKKKFVKSVTTYADANVKHEFKGKNGLVASNTGIGNDMGGTRYDVGVGVVARVSENVSLFGRGSVEFGGSTNVAGKVSGGLKITW